MPLRQSPCSPLPFTGPFPRLPRVIMGDYAGSDDCAYRKSSCISTYTWKSLRHSGTVGEIPDKMSKTAGHTTAHRATLRCPPHSSHRQQYERWPPHKPPCPITNPTQASRPPSPLWTRPNKGQQATAFLSRLHFAFNHAFSSHPHNQLTLAFQQHSRFTRFLH